MTVIHVVFGTAALLAGPLAFVARKGGARHQLAGRVFTIAMAVVLFSAGFLWQAKGHLFLVPLAAVSAYLLFNGWRALARRRRRRPDEIEDRVDRLAALAAIAAGLATAYLGLTARTPLMISIAPALLGIGSIAVAFAVNELLGFVQPRTRVGWLAAHFASMIAAYISAVTAFVVINAHAVPMFERWFVPSLVGGMTIIASTLKVLRARRFVDPVLRAMRERLAGLLHRPGRVPVAATTEPDDPFVLESVAGATGPHVRSAEEIVEFHESTSRTRRGRQRSGPRPVS